MEFHPDKCTVIRITRKKIIHRYPYTYMAKSSQKKQTQNIVGVTIADNMT